MGKKNGRTRMKERDDWGVISVYTKPHKDLELWGFDKRLDPEYVILGVSGSHTDRPYRVEEVYQIRKAALIKALTR